MSLCESICDREEREGKKKKQTTIYNQLLLTAAEFQKNTQFYWNLRFYIRTSLPFFFGSYCVCLAYFAVGWILLRLFFINFNYQNSAKEIERNCTLVTVSSQPTRVSSVQFPS